ncbi:MAG: type II secretion system minor pseudopilin GspK [Nevskia sp.]|nr:type II secretion system minor pseudopilin GspK [Nevskia sp.]
MKRQAGIALVTAIFVVALASIAAVAMFEASNIAVHRTANLVQSEAEWWYADGIESWVKGVLIEDAKINKNTVGLNGLWAKPVDFLPIDGGAIRGHIEDLQGRFNLNNLGPKPTPQNNPNGGQQQQQHDIYMEQFERLLDNLPNFDASKYRGVGYAIRDWIDADDERSGTDGAEDSDYLGEDPPYRAANQFMISTSELLQVRGVTKELYAALAPYVTALPGNTEININTASEPVLLSLSRDWDKSSLQKLLAARKLTPLTETATALPADVLAKVSVTSQYFGLHAEVFIGSGRLALYSVMVRQGGGVPYVLTHSTNSE